VKGRKEKDTTELPKANGHPFNTMTEAGRKTNNTNDNDGGAEDKSSLVYQISADRPPTMGSASRGTTTHTKNKSSGGSFVPRPPYSSQELQDIPSIAALEKRAMQEEPPFLAPSLQVYIKYGAEDDESLQANRHGFQRYALRPRVLRNVSHTITRTTILQGRVSLAFPVMIAPFAGCQAIHPYAELEIARAAARAGIVYTVANWSATPLQGIIQDRLETNNQHDNTPPLFFQIYPHKPTHAGEGFHRAHMAALLHYLASFSQNNDTSSGRVVAVMLTCDTVNNSNREKTYQNRQWVQQVEEEVGGFPEPCVLERHPLEDDPTSILSQVEFPSVPELGHSSSMTWDDIHWMKEECQKHGNLALILKGIMSHEDTTLAVQAGVDAIVVSNHGGRQLDGTLGTVEVVQECVQAAKGSKLEVYVDGGIRRGKDVVKCLALGAKCVLVGRPILYGLAVGGGQAGVARALEIFQQEITTVLQLLGCTNSQEVTYEHIHDRLGQQQQPQQRYSRYQETTTRLLWTSAAVALMGLSVVAVSSRSRNTVKR
jgi:(S)-2-hydroxy-acid oxidase